MTLPSPESEAQRDFWNEVQSNNRFAENNWNEHNINQELNVPITMNEIKCILVNCKKGKAPGIDGVVSETLKNGTSLKVLAALFDLCLQCQIMPSVWARAVIAPIPKNSAGDPRTPMNYRGISLLSVVSKLFSAVISARISKHLEGNGQLANEQNGFRPRRSCLDHVFSVYDICKVGKNLNQDTFLVFID